MKHRDQQRSGRRQHRPRTRSSAPTTPARSRSSRTTSRWRRRSAARTSSSSATTSSTRSTSTTTATARRTSPTSSGSRPSRQPQHVPLQHRPDHSIDSPNWNRQQFYSVTRIAGGSATVLATDLACPPCNVGPRSHARTTTTLAAQAVHTLGGGRKVFAGQRLEGFYVDLGVDLRPRRPAAVPEPAPDPARGGAPGVNAHQATSTSTRSRCRCPSTELTRDGISPDRPGDRRLGDRRVGVGQPAAGRGHRRAPERRASGRRRGCRSPGWATRCSTRSSCRWATRTAGTPCRRRTTAQFPNTSSTPSWPGCCRCSTRACSRTSRPTRKPRADLVAILLTGIPAGIVPGFQNFTGTTPADMLRLNMAIPPASSPNALGLLGGDLAGFPNGRRVFDDVVAIELRAIAGADDPAGRPELHAGRRRRRCRPTGLTRPAPRYLAVPVPGDAARRLPDRTARRRCE